MNKSEYTLSKSPNKNIDSIPFRIDSIKTLLSGKDLEPIVNFDKDNKIGGTLLDVTRRSGDRDDESVKSYDTRVVLKKKIYDFGNIITQIGGQLSYIKSGTTGHTFKGEGANIEYAVKVVAYPKKEKYGNINDVRRPENAELLMIKTLSELIVKKYTPHIVLPIGTFNTDIKTFVGLVESNVIDKSNKHYKEFIERYKKGEYFNEVSILISEWANRGDLLDFIRKHYQDFTPMHWKVIFFQILSVLAVIQNKYPAFRHNDMKANNILIHKMNKINGEFRYRVEKTNYIVPNIGYQIKLWDFDFACIPNVVDNTKVCLEWTKNINVTPEQNRYYDMHYFFGTLIRDGFFPKFMTENCIPKEAKEFVNRIVPPKYRSGKDVHKRGRILTTDEYLTPDEVLKSDPYFKEFRTNKIKTSNIKKSEIRATPNIEKFLLSENEKELDNKIIKTKLSSKKQTKKILSTTPNITKFLNSDSS
jgi:hypothetical protein